MLTDFKKRVLLLSTSFLFLASCNSEQAVTDNKNYLVVSILDTIAEIKFPNTLLLDTNYAWTDYGDTDCSNTRKTRFQNKEDSIFKETGFIHIGIPPKHRTYLTFRTKEHFKCLDRLNPLEFDKYAKFYGDNTLKQQTDFGNKIKKIADFTLTNKKGTKIYTVGYIQPPQKDQSIIYFSCLVFNSRNNIPIKLDLENVSANYDKSFIKSCFEIINNLDIK